MLAILSHFLRYSIWAVVGAALGTLIFYLWVLQESYVLITLSPAVALLPIVAGIAAVFVRAIIGIITCYPASGADRLTAQGVGRFLFGWILGRLAMSIYLSVAPLNRDLSHMLWSGWLEIAFRLAGALAMVAIGWLASRRRCRFFLPIAWVMVFAILTYASVAAWLSFHKEFSRLLKSIFR